MCDQLQGRKDFSDVLKDMGIPTPPVDTRNTVLSLLGRNVGKVFEPDGSAQKFCGGKPRDVKTYHPRDYEAIKQHIWNTFVGGTFDRYYGGRRNLSDRLLENGRADHVLVDDTNSSRVRRGRGRGRGRVQNNTCITDTFLHTTT